MTASPYRGGPPHHRKRRRARKLQTAAQQSYRWRGSFAEHDLEAEPHRADKTGDDDGDHRLERIALHAAEDDDAVAGRCDLVAVDSELVAEAQRRDLAFYQALGGLRQRPLRFANADRRRAALGLAG